MPRDYKILQRGKVILDILLKNKIEGAINEENKKNYVTDLNFVINLHFCHTTEGHIR
jgi:hypothetical protein